MAYLQQNMQINNEPIFAIAKVSNKTIAAIIGIKYELAINCKPINVSFDKKKHELNVSGFIFQLSKIKKNDW
jgi:hypothetical protein